MAWSILLPLGGAVATFLSRRYASRLTLLFGMATAVCVGALGWQLALKGPQRHHIGGWQVPVGIDLYADGLAVLMLAVTALVGLLISFYATAYFPKAGQEETGDQNVASSVYFWPLWLFLWGALNALFLSADLFNIYVTLELLGLSAVALSGLSGKAEALSAAMRYLFVSMIGSLSYLLGVALLYNMYGVLDLGLLASEVRPGPTSQAALALITVGLALKTALFPFHFWLPPAHANAPAPVSALLSALVVKASFYLLLRLWLGVFPTVINTTAVDLLGFLGALAIIWGSIQAFRQRRLKLLVAYSTVAQLGYLFLVFPLVLRGGDFTAWGGSAYLAVSHAFAKASIFLASGIIMHVAGHDRIDELAGIGQRLPVTMFALALAGVSLLGLPPSGGFIAKWMLLNAALITGQWWLVAVIILGGLLAAGYVFRMLAHSFTPATWISFEQPVARRMEWSAFALAAVAIALGLVAEPPLTLLQSSTSFAGPGLREMIP